MPESSCDRDDEGGLPLGGGLVDVKGHGTKLARSRCPSADPRDSDPGDLESGEPHRHCAPASNRAGLPPSPAPLVAAGWWIATLATLVVLDDLTFGPFFWAISRLRGAGAAVAAVYIIYVPVQVYLVHRATEPEASGRFATFFLSRLRVERRSEAIAEREEALHGRVLGTGSAVALSLVIGGVLPLLLLWRRGFPPSVPASAVLPHCDPVRYRVSRCCTDCYQR
ncbi:MAG: hypothetical protein V9E94_18290 [Microthrixaceae bacterium]